MLLEAVEELFVDIREEFHLYLFVRCLLVNPCEGRLLLHDATAIHGGMIIERHGDVLLLIGLIANQRQGHEEGACHEDHRAEVGVRVVQQVGDEELLSEKHLYLAIHAILREKGDEFFKSASLFDQIVEDQGHRPPVQLLRVEVPGADIGLESLKVHVNVDSHKFGDSLWTSSLRLNLTVCLL